MRDALKVRGDDFAIVDDLISMDSSRRDLARQAEELRAHRNRVSKEIGASKNKVKGTESQEANDIDDVRFEMRKIGESIKELDEQLDGIESRMRAALVPLPNIPLDSVPIGDDEANLC